MTTIAAIILAPIFADGGHWWTVPLLLVGLLAGMYPSRRQIFGERWSFAAYLRHTVFSGIGMIGFWILLALSPSVIAGVGAMDARLAFVAAAVLAAMLIACQLNYPRFWLAMHRAEPLDRPDLAPRFEAILARATCPPPGIHRFGAPGGHIMNALALPHPRRPAVALGDAVLEHLEPREIAAVLAHEVAHLEHFDKGRLRRLGGVSLALIALSTALTAVLVVMAPAYASWFSLGIMLTIVGTLGVIASRSQANETASDLRAMELTDDPDALIDALTRLHVHLRLPRQWPHEVETSVSHPSLARRIRAIRERAQVAAPALRHTTIAHTPAATMRVALDETRAYWFEGLPADTPDDLKAMREHASSYRAVSYDELSELRLVPAANGKALKARDLRGKSWVVSIRAEDVPPLHEALSVVDARLGQLHRSRAKGAPQLLAAAMLLAFLAAGQAGVVLVPALLLLIRPGAAPLAALGAMALARVAAAVASGEVSLSGAMALAGLGGMLILAVVALVMAWRGRRALRPQEFDPKPSLVALGATAGLLALVIASRASGISGAELMASPLLPALAVVAIGIAAVLALNDAHPLRRGGVAIGIAAVALLIAGLRGARQLNGPALHATAMTAQRVSEVPLQDGGHRIELSPEARHFAMQGAVGSEHESLHDQDALAFRWTLGALDGGTRIIDAIDLAFVDDARVLTVASQRDSLLVGVEDVAASPDHATAGRVWRRTIPVLLGPQLFVDRAERRWSIVGRSATGELVAYSGSVDDDRTVAERRWGPDSVWTQPMQVTADGSLIGYSIEHAAGGVWPVVGMLTGSSMRFAVWRHDGERRVRLGTIHGVPQCRSDAGRLLCAGRGTDRAQLWGSRAGGSNGPVGLLPSGYDVRSVGQGGPLVAVERTGERVLVVDAESGVATRYLLRGAADGRLLLDAKSAGSVLATLEVDGTGTRLGVYRVR